MKHTKSYIENHPNLQFTRKDWKSLNGEWDFLFDNNNEGVKNKWFTNFPKESLKINVPFAHQTKNSGINKQELANIVWYHREFDYQLIENKRMLLHFEGSDYETTVYVNGHQLKQNKGAYHRFSVDITDYLNNNETNFIVVQVKDSYNATQPRGKQRWMSNSYECFYVDTTGIWKDVWLEQVGETYLKKVKITPDVESYSVFLNYELDGDLNDIEVKTTVTFNDLLVASNSFSPTRNEVKTQIEVSTDTQTMKLYYWNPDAPNLYDLNFKVYYKNELIEEVNSYFGMRKFENKGNTIYLNNHPIYLRMVLDQGYFEGELTPTEQELITDVKLMKEMGFNGVRKHEKIEDQRFSYYADIFGLITWIEMPSFYEYTDSSIKNIQREWMKILEQHYNHPSVMTWVLLNESWGVSNIANNKSEQDLSVGLYHLTRSYDQTRTIISNDGWEHTKSDLITVHNYAETYEELFDVYDDMENKLFKNKKTKYFVPKAVFANGYEYEGQPIIMSEFAGIAFQKDSNIGWGYGDNVANDEEYIKRLSDQIRAIRDNNSFSGYCITQLTDVQQEVNGLLYFDRKPKIDIEIIKKINSI